MNEIKNYEWLTWKKNLDEKFKIHPLEFIQWEATTRCDMNCVHCGSPQELFNPEKELLTCEVERAFTQIKNTFDLTHFKCVTITGGEPFIRKDLFELIGLFNSFGWLTTIQTNGNYLSENPDKIKTLLELGVGSIGVDIDGLERTHDGFRRRPGHFEQTIELIKKFKNYGDKLFATVTTVVSKYNFHELESLWSLISGIDPHRWRLIPVENIGRAYDSGLSLDITQYQKLMEFIKEKRIENFGKRAVQTEFFCTGWIGKKWEFWVRPYIGSCIAGKTVLGIMHDGGIGACAHIDRSLIQGDVRMHGIKEIWEKRFQIFRDTKPYENPLNASLCDGCEEREFCTGCMHKAGPDEKLRECVYRTINIRKPTPTPPQEGN